MPPWTPNWHLVLEKIPLKLIPRSRNGPIFYTPFYRAQQEYNSLLVNALNRFCKSNLFLNTSNGCLQNWSFSAFEILYPILENASEMDTPF